MDLFVKIIVKYFTIKKRPKDQIFFAYNIEENMGYFCLICGCVYISNSAGFHEAFRMTKK